MCFYLWSTISCGHTLLYITCFVNAAHAHLKLSVAICARRRLFVVSLSLPLLPSPVSVPAHPWLEWSFKHSFILSDTLPSPPFLSSLILDYFHILSSLLVVLHLLFLFLSSSAKNRKAKCCCCIKTRTAAVTQYPSFIFRFPKTNVTKIKYIVVGYSSHWL